MSEIEGGRGLIFGGLIIGILQYILYVKSCRLISVHPVRLINECVQLFSNV